MLRSGILFNVKNKQTDRVEKKIKMSLPATFDLTPEDAQLLLAANAHLGARNVQVCYDLIR